MAKTASKASRRKAAAGKRSGKKKKKQAPPHRIGTMGEKSLHASLKKWYARRGDRYEVVVDGFHIDIRRSGMLIEIQTANFSSLKRKLDALTENHNVRLIYPIAENKYIVRMTGEGRKEIGRRKSPKHGEVTDLFEELVSIPRLVRRPNFSLEVVLIEVEEVRRDDGQGSFWRHGWSIDDRRLLAVNDSVVFESPGDYAALLPDGLPDPFTTRDLADALDKPVWLAQKMAYCLREMDVLEIAGKKGNAYLYVRPLETAPSAR